MEAREWEIRSIIRGGKSTEGRSGVTNNQATQSKELEDQVKVSDTFNLETLGDSPPLSSFQPRSLSKSYNI